MITDLGSATLSVVVPGAASAVVAIDIACGIAAPDVSAQLTALASFTPTLNLSFAAQLDIAASIVTNINAAITAGITPPSLDAQIALSVDIIADLQAKLVLIEAQAAIGIALGDLLANAGVRTLVYSGPQDDFGSELSAELGAPTTACNALVLLTTNGATWTAMQSLFTTA